VPNETTWNVNKKLIDERRAAGEPDFQPEVDARPAPTDIIKQPPSYILAYLSTVLNFKAWDQLIILICFFRS
jgi:hypothetical protein